MKGAILIIGDKEVDSTKLVAQAESHGVSIDLIENVKKRINDISEKLFSLSSKDYDIIFTIGGTGMDKDDVTPEATEMVVDKKIPGLEFFILHETVNSAYTGMFARIVAGVRKNTIIVNLPAMNYEIVFTKIMDAARKLRELKGI